MKRKKMIHIAASATLLVFCLGISGLAQSLMRAEEPIAAIAADSAEIRFQPRVDYARLTLRVSAPSGEVFSKEFEAGTVPAFKLFDHNGSKLADGNYVYELRVTPRLNREVREALAAARAKGDDEAVRDLERSGKLTTQAAVQSGSFSIRDGAADVGGIEEPRAPGDTNVSLQSAGKKKSGSTSVTPLDVVTPDDIIVQGSACIGLDCVNNENFGFDTIRLKENNTRIKFEDTSVGSFPTNDWQLTANDSASGASSKFSIEDITGSKVPFTVTAGAATNSIFVDSIGRVGMRTSTPVLDLHINTANTPAHRLEQNSSGGFAAQTWDIAGNEANFFVRDVTGGSRLPFRIRPGAPTSSIDINSVGNVGIGTASPARKMELSGSGNVGMKITDTSISNAAFLLYLRNTNASLAGRQFSIFDENAAVDRFVINASGQIGFGGALSPTNPLEHGSGARLTAGGVWTDASSRALKMNIRGITALEAFRALPGLNPVKFEYKAQPGETYAGFIAEDVPDLVAQNDRRTLSPMDIVAVLTKVVQEQQKTINQLKAKMSRLEKRVGTASVQRRTSR